MSEGFFPPEKLSIPALSPETLCGAMVRILPKTVLALDLAPTEQAASEQARNEALPDGTECWHRFFTREDLAKVDDPEFAMGMVRHEFAQAVKAGRAFPTTAPLAGGGSGFAIDAAGHVLTNYHLVTSEIANHQRESGVIGEDALCRTLRVQIAQRNAAGQWEWRDADAVWLVSNPPASHAIGQGQNGMAELRQDVALLRVEPCPSRHLALSARPLEPGEPVWMAGFPLRSARSREARAEHGYDDADGTLRVSAGKVLSVEADGYFHSDADGSMGNSGSPVLDAAGRVVGLFSRATGNGPRNAFEYGHMQRVHVSASLAVESLALTPRLEPACAEDHAPAPAP